MQVSAIAANSSSFLHVSSFSPALISHSLDVYLEQFIRLLSVLSVYGDLV
jgi:hypothetical protein